jgi:exo-beta-1,3-glucanase (GH17 family)
MSNIHPFFGGVTADLAGEWTYSFWQNHDVSLTAGMADKTHIISEFGWPSEGGNKCGQVECTTDTEGSVASIDNMNLVMDEWVCEALTNGTDYFW